MKVNLGCGRLPLEGYVNVDKYTNEADIKADVLECEFEDVEDVVAFHLLEHLSKSDAALLLMKARKWMVPGGTLTVEVPDMTKILELGTSGSNWASYIYGSPECEGEAHKWGYTVHDLAELVRLAGWGIVAATTFYSRESQRMNMPCALVVARA